MGLGDEAFGPAVRYFTHQQLSYWAANTLDPWVVATLTHGTRCSYDASPLFQARSQ